MANLKSFGKPRVLSGQKPGVPSYQIARKKSQIGPTLGYVVIAKRESFNGLVIILRLPKLYLVPPRFIYGA